MKAIILTTVVLVVMPGLAQTSNQSILTFTHIDGPTTFVLNEADLHCKDGEKVVDHKEGVVHTFKCEAIPVDPSKPDWKLQPVQHWVPSCSAGYELWSEPDLSPSNSGGLAYLYQPTYIDHKVDIDAMYGPNSKADDYECRLIGSKPKEKAPRNYQGIWATTGGGGSSQ